MNKSLLIVEIYWLLVLSGITWTGVGIMLARLAFIWFTPLDMIHFLLHTSLGILFGFGFYRLILYRVTKKNIKRIFSLLPKAHILKFQELKSYVLIILMISMGIFLRTTGIIQKIYLGILYLTIGFGLFIGSFHYYHASWKIKQPQNMNTVQHQFIF